MTAPLHLQSARSIAYAVRHGQVSAVDVTRHFLDRIARLDPELDAFVSVDPDFALRSARFVDQAVERGEDPGPLAGVPFAVKDNLCTSWAATTCGSRHLLRWTPPYDADAVERFLAAGAIPLGKTNLDEFGMGSSTEHSIHGPTRNPWDRTRSPGGSSGGSAAAVAAGLVPLALGSDTGGSVRQPAALCGVVGAIGTYGRVSRRGLVAFASSMDRVGVIARHAADAALALRLLCGGDPGDATSLFEPAGQWEAAAAHDVRGMSIGVLRTDVSVDPDVDAACRRALGHLTHAGARVADVRLASLSVALGAYTLIAFAEAASNLARFDGVRYGARVAPSPRPSDEGPAAGTDAADTFDAAVTRARTAGFGDEVKRRILLGTFATSRGHAQRFYAQAARVRRRVADEFDDALRDVDVVLSPTSPFPAFPLGARTGDPLAMYRCDAFTVPASLAGLPALSVPVGRTPDGLPVGLQIVAPARQEERLFRVAAALREHLGAPELPAECA